MSASHSHRFASATNKTNTKPKNNAEILLRDHLREDYIKQLQIKNKNMIKNKTTNFLKIATAEAKRMNAIPTVTTSEIKDDSTPLEIYSFLSSNLPFHQI